MKTLAASIIAITLVTPAAVAGQQKSMCESSPESCPACGHEGQPRCPTFAEEERAAKAQGCHQMGVGSAYVHLRANVKHGLETSRLGPVRPTGRKEVHEIRQSLFAMGGCFFTL